VVVKSEFASYGWRSSAACCAVLRSSFPNGLHRKTSFVNGQILLFFRFGFSHSFSFVLLMRSASCAIKSSAASDVSGVLKIFDASFSNASYATPIFQFRCFLTQRCLLSLPFSPAHLPSQSIRAFGLTHSKSVSLADLNFSDH